jgi:4-hydroxy-3-methylbut-2-enyl diphosphate reductase
MHLVENLADVERLQVTKPDRLAYVTQTTLSMDDAAGIVAGLQQRFPGIVGPRKDDICYATQNRQDAVKHLAMEVGVVLVVGSKNSSNSNRLREVAEHLSVPAYLIDDASQIDPAWFEGVERIGVTAGASAPEVLVCDVVKRLTAAGGNVTTLQGVDENVSFPLPRAFSEPTED